MCCILRVGKNRELRKPFQTPLFLNLPCKARFK
jgi:hypothetical protein